MKEISRKDWGANPPKKGYSKNIDIKGLAVHYTAMAAPNTEDEEFKQLRNIQKFHQVDRGWNDIGYSFLVGNSGNLYIGRGKGARPASQGTNDGNKHYYSVCWLGAAEDTPSEAALNTIKELWQEIGGEIKPHSDFKATACCGDYLRNWIKEVKSPQLSNESKDHPINTGSIEEKLKELEKEIESLKAKMRSLEALLLKGNKPF
jgi:N-acetylmuramoyl-L-alanine amidase